MWMEGVIGATRGRKGGKEGNVPLEMLAMGEVSS